MGPAGTPGSSGVTGPSGPAGQDCNVAVLNPTVLRWNVTKFFPLSTVLSLLGDPLQVHLDRPSRLVLFVDVPPTRQTDPLNTQVSMGLQISSGGNPANLQSYPLDGTVGGATVHLHTTVITDALPAGNVTLELNALCSGTAGGCTTGGFDQVPGSAPISYLTIPL